MKTNKTHNPWLWIPVLCAAEEIPSAVVMFVSLIMFLQFGANDSWAAFYSGLLFLPWVTKSYVHSKVKGAGAYKRYLHLSDLLIFLCLMGVAIYILQSAASVWLLFVFMFVLSCLCAWHELLSRMYYSRMLYPREQRLFTNTKMLASQSTLVVTYGVLIIIAGFFEVFFRSYQKAWAMESSLVAGVFLALFALNFFTLHPLHVSHHYYHESFASTVKHEISSFARFREKHHVMPVLISLFFLLLPQALMFNTRVFFLFAEVDKGGLGCSVQDVGFAQGTIGVLAFSIGIALGHALTKKHGFVKMFWPTAIVLTLSPFSYMLMSQHPQVDNLFLLCMVTFFAQFCFGFGLNVCRSFVTFISGQRYRNTTNFLYVPLVNSLMIVPMALSGWLSSVLGYQLFFVACSCLAPLSWLILKIYHTKTILNEQLASAGT